MQRKSEFSSHLGVVVRGAQQKLLHEAEKPREGNKVHASSLAWYSLNPQVCRQGQSPRSGGQLQHRHCPQRPPHGPARTLALGGFFSGSATYFSILLPPSSTRAWAGTLALAICLKPAAKASPSRPSLLSASQLSSLGHGNTNRRFSVPNPRLSTALPGASC